MDEMLEAVGLIHPENLEREVVFARAALVPGDEATERWLALLVARVEEVERCR